MHRLQDSEGLEIIAGRTGGAPRNFSVTTMMQHPEMDVALLQLGDAINPGVTMRPICLPAEADDENALDRKVGM